MGAPKQVEYGAIKSLCKGCALVSKIYPRMQAMLREACCWPDARHQSENTFYCEHVDKGLSCVLSTVVSINIEFTDTILYRELGYWKMYTQWEP